MLLFKNKGINTDEVKPAVWYALGVASEILDKEADVDAIVTSMNDGVHKIGSRHYSGEAVDLRSKHISNSVVKERVYNALFKALAKEGFDVLLEGKGSTNEHFHIEYDPKGERKFGTVLV